LQNEFWFLLRGGEAAAQQKQFNKNPKFIFRAPLKTQFFEIFMKFDWSLV